MGLSIEERYEDFLNACLNSDYELVEDIIFDRTFRININRSLKDGANALVIAVQQNDYQLVKLLLLNGADADSRIENGWSALMIAIRMGSFEIVKMIVDKGADVNINSPEGLSPLMLAAFCNNLELCKLLLQKGADINAVSKDGKTALNQAKSKELKEFLVENGAEDISTDTKNYKFIEKDLKTAQENYDFAQELLIHCLYDKSIIYFDRTIELDKKFARAYTGKGLALLMLDKPYDAIAYFTRATYMNQYDSEAFL